MKRAVINNSIILVICCAYILLFTYAAVTKLLDYNDFSIQIGQSPLLTAFAGIVAYVVPIAELLIVILLSIPRLRSIGLYSCFCLMAMFTTYIFLILNFSSNIPCSCGGILEKMGWTEHLIFNMVFITLALVALIIDNYPSWPNYLKPLHFTLTMLAGFLISVGAIVALYLISEKIIHSRNNYVRRFPAHARLELKKVDLQYNSYYFAGIDKDKIYLGNTTAPLNVTIFDTALNTKERVRITVLGKNLPYRSLQLRVQGQYFFILDGSIPFVYKGNTKDWIAKPYVGKVPGFNFAEPIDSLRFVYRRLNTLTDVNEVGIFKLDEQGTFRTNPNLLEKQTDGAFDTDGILLANPALDKFHYVYFYRNQYVTADTSLRPLGKGRTIDTVSKANIKTAVLSSGEKTMARPPLLVNRLAAIAGNTLFIHSERVGKYEDHAMVQHASLIDVYDLSTGKYNGSMYVYKIEDEKIKSFRVFGNSLYVLSGKYLSVGKIDAGLLSTDLK